MWGEEGKAPTMSVSFLRVRRVMPVAEGAGEALSQPALARRGRACCLKASGERGVVPVTMAVRPWRISTERPHVAPGGGVMSSHGHAAAEPPPLMMATRPPLGIPTRRVAASHASVPVARFVEGHAAARASHAWA